MFPIAHIQLDKYSYQAIYDAMWDVEFSNEFGEWWGTLTEDEQDSLTVSVKLLQAIGPSLARPYADTVKQSRHSNMRIKADAP